MRDVIVKVPDKTVFIHVLIGVDEQNAVAMYAKMSYKRNGNFNIEFPEEGEQNETD